MGIWRLGTLPWLVRTLAPPGRVQSWGGTSNFPTVASPLAGMTLGGSRNETGRLPLESPWLLVALVGNPDQARIRERITPATRIKPIPAANASEASGTDSVTWIWERLSWTLVSIGPVLKR